MALPLFHLARPVSTLCLAGNLLTPPFFFPVSLVWFSHLALSCPAIGWSASSLTTSLTPCVMDFPRCVCEARVKQHRRGGQKTAFRNSTLGPGIEPRWPDCYGRSMINNFHKTFTVWFQPKNQRSSPSSAQFPVSAGNPVLSIFTPTKVTVPPPPNVFNRVLLSHKPLCLLKVTKHQLKVECKRLSD